VAKPVTACFLEPEAFSNWARQEVRRRFRLVEDPEKANIVLLRVGRRMDCESITQMPALRAVVSPTTGIDHIDVDECTRRNIEVITLKGEVEFLSQLTNTAEHAFGLLLALYRRLVPAFEEVREGSWRQAPYRGHSLFGKAFGIVGHGRLGRIAGDIARGFGMKVLAYDPGVSSFPKEVSVFSDLVTMARCTDVLSLHASLNQGNHGMIDAGIFDQLPSHAVLINTARGQLVDEAALLEALSRSKIAGAALDVVCNEERFDRNNTLARYSRKNDNLLLSPHIGGQTFEAVEAADKFIVSKLNRWCAENGH